MADANPTEPQPEHGEHTEAQLRQREELRRMVDLIPQTIIVLNPNEKAIYANRVALKYGAVVGRSAGRRFSGSRIPLRGCEAVSRRTAGKSLRHCSIRKRAAALGKDGKCRWLLIRYSPLLDENGKAVRWYATATDIEDRKRAQEALRKALDQGGGLPEGFRGVIGKALGHLDEGPRLF